MASVEHVHALSCLLSSELCFLLLRLTRNFLVSTSMRWLWFVTRVMTWGFGDVTSSLRETRGNLGALTGTNWYVVEVHGRLSVASIKSNVPSGLHRAHLIHLRYTLFIPQGFLDWPEPSIHLTLQEIETQFELMKLSSIRRIEYSIYYKRNRARPPFPLPLPKQANKRAESRTHANDD